MKAIVVFMAVHLMAGLSQAGSLSWGDAKFAAYKAVLTSPQVESQISTLNQQGYNVEAIAPTEPEGKSIQESFVVSVTKREQDGGRVITCHFNVLVGDALHQRTAVVKREVREVQPLESMQCQ